jgi:hypothetical protein
MKKFPWSLLVASLALVALIAISSFVSFSFSKSINWAECGIYFVVGLLITYSGFSLIDYLTKKNPEVIAKENLLSATLKTADEKIGLTDFLTQLNFDSHALMFGRLCQIFPKHNDDYSQTVIRLDLLEPMLDSKNKAPLLALCKNNKERKKVLDAMSLPEDLGQYCQNLFFRYYGGEICASENHFWSMLLGNILSAISFIGGVYGLFQLNTGSIPTLKIVLYSLTMILYSMSFAIDYRIQVKDTKESLDSAKKFVETVMDPSKDRLTKNDIENYKMNLKLLGELKRINNK